MGLTGLKSRFYSTGLYSFLEVRGENSFLCLFQLLRTAPILLLVALVLHLQSQQCHMSLTIFSIVMSLLTSVWKGSLLLRNNVIRMSQWKREPAAEPSPVLGPCETDRFWVIL